MSEFREQAVKDVDEEFSKWETVETRHNPLPPHRESYHVAYTPQAKAYAVSQRERVLELEAENANLKKGIIQSGDWTFRGKSPAELMKLIAQAACYFDTGRSLLAEPEREKGK